MSGGKFRGEDSPTPPGLYGLMSQCPPAYHESGRKATSFLSRSMNQSIDHLDPAYPTEETMPPPEFSRDGAPTIKSSADDSMMHSPVPFIESAMEGQCITATTSYVETPARLADALVCSALSDGSPDGRAPRSLAEGGCGMTADGTGASGGVLAAFDFKDSSTGATAPETSGGSRRPLKLNVEIWYNASNTGKPFPFAKGMVSGKNLPLPTADTSKSVSTFPDLALMLSNRRIPALMNMATNSFIKAAMANISRGAREESSFEVVLLGTREMPKPPTHGIQLDFNVLTGPLFFTWAAQMPFPDTLRGLVYERETRARIMMRVHGLRDVTYWLAQFLWDLAINCRYLMAFSFAGHAAGLTIFTANSVALQAMLFLLFAGVQVWGLLASDASGLTLAAAGTNARLWRRERAESRARLSAWFPGVVDNAGEYA